MGEAALRSHANGAKHRQLAIISDRARVSDFFRPAQQRPSGPAICQAIASSSSAPPNSLTSFVSGNDSLRAEVLWCLKVVCSHYFCNSRAGLSELCWAMYPDSDVARRFSCSERKCAYMACFGLGLYFKDLMKDVQGQSAYVLLFDKSMNQKTKKQTNGHPHPTLEGELGFYLLLWVSLYRICDGRSSDPSRISVQPGSSWPGSKFPVGSWCQFFCKGLILLKLPYTLRTRNPRTAEQL